MAESANPAIGKAAPGKPPVNPAAVPPPVPEPAPAVIPPPQVQVKPPSRARVLISNLLTTTFWMGLALGFLFLSILFRYEFAELVPTALQPYILKTFKDLPYFFAGLGLLCAGVARNFVRGDYAAETAKSRLFLHAWKVPLVAGQVWIFIISGLYALGAGIGLWKKLSDTMGLTTFLLLFFGYNLWYLTAHFLNRFRPFAGLRLAAVSLILAVLAYGAWAGQYIFFSLIFSLFALLTAFTSAVVAATYVEEQKGGWPMAFCLLGSLVFIVLAAMNIAPRPHLELLDTALITQDVAGSVEDSTYSQDGRKLAFIQKNSSGWFLEVVSPDSGNLPIFKVGAGEGDCRPVFVDGGKSILLDAVQNGVRNLWQVNAGTGDILILSHEPMEPFADGRPWNEAARQLLYVTHDGGKYALKAYSLDKHSSATLLTASEPFGTPSWSATGDEVSYVDGESQEPYVYNLETKENLLLTPAMETADEAEGEKPKAFLVTEAFSAPDDFRYLFVARQGKTTGVWSVMPDGSKRVKLYETEGTVRRVSWTPDAQKIVFEEKDRRFGFFAPVSRIQVLEANTGRINSLIVPQISHHSPASSPDGAKIAFAAREGLWVTSPLNRSSGVWLAILR